MEVKPAGDDAWLTAESSQVSQYWDHYRLVLVTNTRDFVLLGEDAEGQSARLETFRLAGSAGEFEQSLQHPRTFARDVGAVFGEYLCRALSHRARGCLNPATWPGCWPPMPVTGWPGLRLPAMHHPSPRCGPPWRRPWA